MFERFTDIEGRTKKIWYKFIYFAYTFKVKYTDNIDMLLCKTRKSE